MVGALGQRAVDLLVLMSALVAILIYAAFSCGRSYFQTGRKRGIEEAVRELARGVGSHFELEGGALPATVEKALNELKALPERRLSKKDLTKAYHAQLWVLGDAIGEACWIKGQAAGVRRKAPAEGKIRIDLALGELLQLGWLAHLGFQHMMPNYRSFESYRFSGKGDAEEAARAVGRLEASVPSKDRPVADLTVQFKSRQQLISDWWQATPDRLTA
jgi:hypothetical protein